MRAPTASPTRSSWRRTSRSHRPGRAWARARYDLVLLDPPRSGAAALLPALANWARRIAYVSCDAATLARDAAVLCARGAWSLTHAGVFAMFPQTAHFESLAVFAPRA